MDINKLKKNMEQSCKKIINNNNYIKEKFGKDLSDTDNDSDINSDVDSDIDDGMSKFEKRNSNLISQIANDNSSIRMTNVKNKLKDKKKELKSKKEKDSDISDYESENSDEDDSDSDNESYVYEFQKEFELCVVNYTKADDMINVHKDKMKDLTKIKKECEEEILKHLEKVGINSINVSGGKLIKNQYSDKGKPKEDLVKSMIKKNCENETSQKIFDDIDKEHAKNKKTRTSLKRTHEKTKKK
jgi:hypothetical protein